MAAEPSRYRADGDTYLFNFSLKMSSADCQSTEQAEEDVLSVFRAIRQGNTAEVKSFLDAGGDIETFGGRFHGTLLLESCRFHTSEVADLLLERGAAVNASGGGSWTPLHYACDGQEASSLVATLIRHHASVHAADFYGRTPLHMASRQGSSNAALALLEAGADPNAPDKDRRTPLHYASFHGHRSVIAVLFSFGGDVSSLDRELSTPLHMATLMRRSIVKNLLERVGADVNAVDCWGRLAGTLAPSYKMRPAANDKIDRHQGADKSARGKHDNEGASSRKCVACSATKGRHYYFCRSDTLHGIPEHLILGPNGLPIAEGNMDGGSLVVGLPLASSCDQ